MTTRRLIHIPEMTAEETDRVVDLLCEIAHYLINLRPHDEEYDGFGTIEDFETIFGQADRTEV